MEHEQLEGREVEREREARRRERRDEHRQPPVTGSSRLQAGEAEDEQHRVARHAVERHGDPQEVGVAARLHHFAAAGPALELADDTDLVQPEVRRDQQPHEREEHDGLPPDHLRVRVRLSTRAWKASDVACPSNRLPFTKKLGVPWTPARSPSSRLAWMRPAYRWPSVHASYFSKTVGLDLEKYDACTAGHRCTRRTSRGPG